MAQVTHQLLHHLIKAYNLPVVGTRGARVAEHAVQLLSNDASGRTNQFEVKARLEGIVEKCRILNNDPLGDALEMRLDELSVVSNQWTPEILSLLLTLSDRPIHNARVEDLPSVKCDPPAELLTWKSIIEEDPLEDQTAIWRDVDFAADSSDEDKDVNSELLESSADEDSLEPSGTEETEVDLEALTMANEKNALEGVSNGQVWREQAPKGGKEWPSDEKDAFEVTELTAVREVIFMLLGLPTSIFHHTCDSEFPMIRNVQLRHTSQEPVTHLLNMFLELGQKLSTIRRWLKQDISIPLEQSFQFALETQMKIFHSILHAIEGTTMDISCTIIISLLDVFNKVRVSSRLLLQLHDILVEIMPLGELQRPFRILQSLYSQTCINQKVGDDEGYECMAQVLFQCFRIYLKPIQAWMETGEADMRNPVIFIEKSKEEVKPHSLWQYQYRLLFSADGALKAPQFLHMAGTRILNTGKSVNFLKKLGVDIPMQKIEGDSVPFMSYEDVCLIEDPHNLSPFPDLFDTALARWIAGKHRSSSVLLREQLESRCGLQKVLNALEHLYFYSNGALSGKVVHTLFERIECGKQHWNDAFITTALFHEAFAMVDCIDLDRLSVRQCVSKHASNSKGRSMGILENFYVSYILPWPVANIIRPESMTIYQRIFVLLTQTERARFLLQRNKLPIKTSNIFYAVHTNLLWFVNTLLSHLTTLVIAVNNATMHHNISFAEDVDAMIAVHQAYIAKLEDQCFLTKSRASLRQAILSILDLAVLFSDLQPTLSAQEVKNHHSKSASSSEGEDDDGRPSTDKPIVQSRDQPEERLAQLYEMYRQLLTIVTATVESFSKADGDPTWAILAGNLAFGGVR